MAALLLLSVGMGLGHWISGWLNSTPEKETVVAVQEQVAKGPWGTLQITRITIERPDEFISVNRNFNSVNRWFFENFQAEQLRNFFRQEDLTAQQQAALLDESRWQISSNGIYVTPGAGTILSLASAARQRIYRLLATHEFNYYQQNAFAIRASAINEWFQKSGLSPETEKLIRGLLYHNAGAVCFADMTEAMSLILDPQERRRLVKMLSRKRTVLVRLRIEEGDDVGPLVEYWGKFGQAKDIRPLLESLARKQGGATVDIVHLMPPFARHRMYTYPLPSEDPVEDGHHCWWSSMNFFNASPDERFGSFDEAKRTIQADYFPVQGDPTFGDVVWFLDSKGVPVHSAVYVAEDFLFTKNGPSFNEPWLLMTFDDLLAIYAYRAPMRVVAYRLKRG